MLDILITSKTRVKLLLKFFLNSNSSSYLRALETEFGESSNAIRVELNRFEKAGLLTSYTESNRKYFRANKKHPLFNDINNILRKYIGIDQIIDEVAEHLGGLEKTYLTGDFARGTDSRIIDILFVGSEIDKAYLLKLIEKAERFIRRKIRYIIIKPGEASEYLSEIPEALLLWEKGS